jgi:hypothetical protein
LLGALGPEFEATLREHHALQSAAAAGGLPEQQYGALSDDRADLFPLKPAVEERLRLILRPFFLKCGLWLTGVFRGRGCVYAYVGVWECLFLGGGWMWMCVTMTAWLDSS